MLRKVRNFVAGAVGAPLLRLLWKTLRITFDDRAGILRNAPRGPVLFTFWHNRMLLMPPFYETSLPGRKGICLISASSDGEMIARIVEHFGIKAARGSSSRYGKKALRELADHLENGLDVAITPDGPRGPKYRIQQGIIGLAEMSGVPIYPLSYDAARKIELNSWDGFIIPLPFTKCRFVIGEPMVIQRTSNENEFEAGRKRLEEALLKLADAQNSPLLA